MKKEIMICALATTMVVNAFSQQNVGTPLSTVAPATNPPGISQLETRARLITQNFFNNPNATQITGNFGTTARWNSMGSLSAGLTQVLNGFRTQTDGRGLTTGYSVAAGVLSNPTIQ